MKKYLLLVVSIVIFLSCPKDTPKQKEKEEITKELPTMLEKILTKRGVTIAREFYNIGRVEGPYETGLRIKALIIEILGEKYYGAHLIKEGLDYRKDQVGYLDYDEITFLIEALNRIIDKAKVMSNQKCEYTEIYYVSRSGAVFGFCQEGLKQKAFVQVNALEMSWYSLTIPQFAKFRDFVIKTQKNLDSLGAKGWWEQKQKMEEKQKKVVS